MPESVLMDQLHLSKACWELWLSDDQPHSDYNGQWQRALCILAVLQSSQPNPQREKRKMYAIKQIKICAEYRDMLPRPRLDLSGTSRLRPIGHSPGSWQSSLGLGSMSRYSSQILICITQWGEFWPATLKSLVFRAHPQSYIRPVDMWLRYSRSVLWYWPEHLLSESRCPKHEYRGQFWKSCFDFANDVIDVNWFQFT